MEFHSPDSWYEALEVKAAQPEAVPIFGGTDVMVDLNFDRERPGAVLDLTRVPELGEWDEADGRLRVGAGVTYTRVIRELGSELPGLAMASRTVGSPQIRNRGTVGGNLGTASPAGDALPPLYVSDAEVELASTWGTRRVPVASFITVCQRVLTVRPQPPKLPARVGISFSGNLPRERLPPPAATAWDRCLITSRASLATCKVVWGAAGRSTSTSSCFQPSLARQCRVPRARRFSKH